MVFKRLVTWLLSRGLAVNVLRTVHDLYAWVWSFVTHRYPFGENVYDRDWDVLIVLDCCRVDALETVADEYDFITDVESMVSVGSTSREWIAKTFTQEWKSEVYNTAYVTANGYPRTIFEWDRYEYPHREGDGEYRRAHMNHVGFDPVSEDDFMLLDQVWKYVPEDMKGGGKVLPKFITDRAIDVARTQNPDRLIVHYMYPHGPYVANAVSENRDLHDHEQNPMMALRNGDVSRETVWNVYLNELRFVLDSVEVLLENIDAETVAITADHGEGFGEWGMYAHLLGAPFPCVKQVPWVETTASNVSEYEPTSMRPDSPSGDLEERLEALGYR